MIDPRFYKCSGALSLKKLSEVSGAEIVTPLPLNMTKDSAFENVATLEDATPSDLSLFHNLKYRNDFQSSKAGVCFTQHAAAELAPKGMALLVSDSPQRSFGLALAALYPHAEGQMSPMTSSPVHPTAQIGEGTILEYGAVVKEKARIGKDCRIGANTVIGAGVDIGNHTWIGQNVTISHAIIGCRVVIYPGVRIGQAGFGFAMDKRGFVTVPQLGRVVIEDDVEIGSNATIDRGSLRDTIIGQGSRLDNLVMIAHNVVLGKGCVLVAQVGIAGSTRLGNYVIAAGQAGFIGHLDIGNGARIGAQSGVMRDIPEGETVLGSPAIPLKDFMRQTATLNRMVKRSPGERKKTRE